MKRLLSTITAVVIIMAMVFSFVACGSTSAAPASSTNDAPKADVTKAAETKAEPAKDGLKGTVTGLVLADFLEKIKPVYEGIEKQNPGLKYEIESVDFDNLDKKINMAHASGADYDFLQVNNSSVAQFNNAKVLVTLNDLLTKANMDLKANYGSGLLSVGTIGKDVLAIPYMPDTRVLAYNKKLVEKSGLPSPKTPEDMLAIAKAVAKNGVYAYVRNYSNPLWTIYCEGCLFMGNGAHVYANVDGKLTATTNTPEMIKAVDFWKEMAPYLPKDVNTNETQQREMFVQGKSIFYTFGPWEFNMDIGKKMKLGEDYDLCLTPGWTKSGSSCGGWFIGLGNGKNQAGGFALIQKLMEPEVIAKTTLGLPADARGFEFAPFNDPKFKIFSEQLKTAEVPMPVSSQFEKIAKVFVDHFNKVLIAKADTASEMKAANDEIAALLAKE